MRQEPPILEPPGFVEYETEAELARAPVRFMRFAWRNRHATIPLSAPFCLLATAELLRRHPEPLWAEGAVAALADVVMWSAAPRKWSAEPRIRDLEWSSEVAYARATVIGASAWLILAARYGPLTPAMEWALGILALGWGVPYWWHKRPRDKRARRRHAAAVVWWNTWWARHATAWSVPGSHIEDIEETGAVTSLLVQLVKGRQTLDHLRGSLRLVESALDEIEGGQVPHGMIRLERVSASRCWLHLKHANPLRETIPFSEDMLPRDITKPAPLGVLESGDWLTTPLRKSTFILGATRSGKSNEESVLFATITGCTNSRLWLIDMKGGRSMRPWLAAVDWPATTMAEAQIMLACAVAETDARATYATGGDEQLEPTAEVPAIFTAIDETYRVTSVAAGRPGTVCARDLASLSSAGAGLEMYAIVTTQYGSLEDSVQTEQTRMNLRRRLCFQVEHADHGTFALGEDSRRGAADPTKLAEPGTFYYRADSKTTLEQVRGPEIPHRRVREIAAANAERTRLHERRLLLYCGNMPCPLFPGKTWQQVYDERWSRLDAAFHADAPQGVTLTPSPAEEAAPVPTKIKKEYSPEVTTAVARINAEVDELPVTVADIARARELRAARGAGDFDLRGEDDRCRRKFAALLDAAPLEGIAPKVLAHGSGYSREWVRLLLNALMEHNAVQRITTGRYRPLVPAWEALEALRAEQERLAADARQMAGV